MKRSVMVQKVIEAVNEANGGFGDFTEEQADRLLDLLETAGMAPPGKAEYNGYGSGDDYFCVQSTKHEWDEE